MGAGQGEKLHRRDAEDGKEKKSVTAEAAEVAKEIYSKSFNARSRR